MKKHQIEKAEKINKINPFKPSFKSRLHQIIEAQEKEKSEEKTEEIHKKHEHLLKLKEFQTKVKKDYFPEIDPQKKQSLQVKVFKLKHPAFKFFMPDSVKKQALTEADLDQYNTEDKNPKTQGKEYLAYAKTHKKIHPNARSLEKIPAVSEHAEDKISLKSSKYENYLRKMGHHVKKEDLEAEVLQNNKLTNDEKKKKIFEKAEIWEGLAERKELLMKIKGDVNLSVEADDLRIKAMKAKLAFLANNNKEESE